jgi:hypothetical protein
MTERGHPAMCKGRCIRMRIQRDYKGHKIPLYPLYIEIEFFCVGRRLMIVPDVKH